MLSTGVPVAVAIVGIALVPIWMRTGPADGLVLRVPGMDGSGALVGGAVLETPVAGEPQLFDVKPSDAPGAWPWFRGPERDGICRESVPLARKWPEGGPEVLWTVEMGPGHAGAAVWSGRVYVLDYDTEARADTMRCLSLDDGREIWRNGYPVVIENDHGMSRAVPAVADGLVVSVGPLCHVVCWDAETGECRWLLDLVNQYRTTVPQWHAAQCPLIDNGRVILAPSGTALLIAVDLQSGEVVWESPELENWEMTHASILPVEFQGKRMYVYNASRGVAGISAEDGSLLWKTTDWVGSKTATCPTPVVVGDGRIFFSAGYNAGSAMLQLDADQDRFVSKTLFRLTPRQFESEQHTPVFHDGHLYGVRTNPGGKQLACFDLEGNELWNSGTDKFERGPYLIADGLLFVMADNGLLTVAEATSAGYKPLDKFQTLAQARHAWGPMALVAGRLILRDFTRMTCLDVSDN
ncbi:MAG: PQQ-like beta-propeller repeat protein [Planctomycetes bacterium]|nr:PQQ-like beta-propeller repeat protein [Planctomycetota bacterium]